MYQTYNHEHEVRFGLVPAVRCKCIRQNALDGSSADKPAIGKYVGGLP